MFNKILSFLGLRPDQVDDTQIREHWRYLARVCRTRRMQKKVSVNQLAKEADVSWNSVDDFEKLHVKTRVSTIRKIFRALGLPIIEVIDTIPHGYSKPVLQQGGSLQDQGGEV
jgi:ribosome-binding protein aMBF1 (putative translation factor)